MTTKLTTKLTAKLMIRLGPGVDRPEFLEALDTATDSAVLPATLFAHGSACLGGDGSALLADHGLG